MKTIADSQLARMEYASREWFQKKGGLHGSRYCIAYKAEIGERERRNGILDSCTYIERHRSFGTFRIIT